MSASSVRRLVWYLSHEPQKFHHRSCIKKKPKNIGLFCIAIVIFVIIIIITIITTIITAVIVVMTYPTLLAGRISPRLNQLHQRLSAPEMWGPVLSHYYSVRVAYHEVSSTHTANETNFSQTNSCCWHNKQHQYAQLDINESRAEAN